MSSDVIICKACGAENNFEANYCSSCGAKLEKKSLSPEVKETEHKRLDTPAFVILIFFLLAIGTGLLVAGGVFENYTLEDFNKENITNKNPDLNASSVDLNKTDEIGRLENVLAKNPNDTKSLLRLANLLSDAGFYNKAVKRYEKYLSFVPNDVDVWVDLGASYFQLGNLKKATESMEKGLSINPNHQIANFNMGVVKWTSGDKEAAKRYFQKAIEVNPGTEIARKAKSLLNKN